MNDLCDTCLGQDYYEDGPCPDCEGGREAAEWEQYWDNLTPEGRREEQRMMSEYTAFHEQLARQERQTDEDR